jgi:hypothetical protein
MSISATVPIGTEEAGYPMAIFWTVVERAPGVYVASESSFELEFVSHPHVIDQFLTYIGCTAKEKSRNRFSRIDTQRERALQQEARKAVESFIQNNTKKTA